jgi:hypothetical protein
VHVSTSLESPPIMGNLRCDWAPMSNRFYLILDIYNKMVLNQRWIRGFAYAWGRC